MPAREIKLFPTPANCQRSGEDELPWAWARDYFDAIVQRLPDDERASVVVRGMAGVSMHGTHLMSQDEVDRERMVMLFQALERARQAGEGIDKEQVQFLVDQFHALA